MYKLFKRFQRKEVSMILLCLLFIVGQVWLDLTMPDYMSEITTLVQTEGSAMADIWLAGGKMLLCALGSLILSVIDGISGRSGWRPPSPCGSGPASSGRWRAFPWRRSTAFPPPASSPGPPTTSPKFSS